METVKVKCPYKNCKVSIVAEIKADQIKDISEKDLEILKQQVTEQILPGLKKHHKDGHPKQ